MAIDSNLSSLFAVYPQMPYLVDISPDNGVANDDFITNNNRLTFIGATEVALAARQAVQVSLDGGATWQTVTPGSGLTWTYTNTTPLSDGFHTISMRVYNTSTGAVVGPTVCHSVFLDTIAPTEVPTIAPTVTNGSTFNGTLSAPLNTVNNTATEFLQISLDNGATWQTVNTVSGTSWTYTNGAALAAGSYPVEVRVADWAGNIGPTTTQTVTVGTLTVPTQMASMTAISPDNGANTGGSANDFITNTGALTLSGTVSSALTSTEQVQVSIDGGAWQTATITGSGLTWSYVLPAGSTLTDGSHAVRTQVYDTSSQLAGPISPNPSVVVDTVAPTETVTIATTATGSTTGDTFTGTLSAPLNSSGGSTEILQISTDGGVTWQNVPSGSVIGTSWTYTSSTVLAAGSHNVEARVADVAGNTGPPANENVTVGPGGTPTAPTQRAELTAISPDTGGDLVGSATDFITDSNHLIFSGTTSAVLTASEQVQISLDNGASWQTATTGADGLTWSYDNRANTLADGSYTVQTRVHDSSSDLAGTITNNVPPVQVDTAVPPEIVTITPTATSSATGDTFTGTLNVPLNSSGEGSTEFLQISTDGTTWHTVSAVSGTSWTYTSTTPLPAGSYTIDARLVDVAGNVSHTFFQTVAVPGPGGTSTEPAQTAELTAISPDTGADTGGTASDFITDTGAITLSGTISAPLTSTEQVRVSLDGGASWQPVTTTDNSSLTWSYTPSGALGNGTFNVEVQVYDTSSKLAGQINSKPVTVDTIAPAETVTISPTTDGQTFTGTLSAALNSSGGTDERLQFRTSDSADWQLVPASDVTGTTWTYTLSTALTPGAYFLEARVVDIAGNTGTSVTQSLTIGDGGSTGTLPAITIDHVSPDAGTSRGDFITGNSDTGLTFTGSLSTALTGSQAVQISLDGGASWVAADASGTTWTYTYSPELADGNYQVEARVINGSQTGLPAIQPLLIDSTAPIELIQGLTVSSDGLTISGTLSLPINGNGGSPEMVVVTINGVQQIVPASSINSTTNAWSLILSTPVANGDTVTAAVWDVAGHAGQKDTITVSGVSSPASSPLPTATIGSISPATGTGQEGTEFVTNQNTNLTLAGTLSAPLASGQTVQVSLDGGANWVTLPATDISGTTWTYAYNGTALSDGIHRAEVEVVSGSQTSALVSQQLFIDTVKPVEQILNLAVSTDGLTVSGTVSPALNTQNDGTPESVAVIINGGTPQLVPNDNVNLSGTSWSLTLTTPIAAGSTVTAEVVDAAGNAGPTATTTRAFSLPFSPASLAATIDSVSPDTGNNSTDFITQASVLTFSGTVSQPLASGEAVQISLDNGATWNTATLSGTTWSYADPNALTDGTYHALARVVDASGAAQSATATQAVTVDTTAPTETTTITGVETGKATLTPTADGSSMGWSTTHTVDVTAQLNGGAHLNQAGGSPESVVFSVDGGNTWHQASSTTGSGTAAQYIATLPNGVYAVETAVEDAAGNVGTVSPAQAFGVYVGGAMNLNLSQVLDVASATGKPVEIPTSSGVTAITLSEGVGSGVNQWTETGTTIIGGTTFDVYHNARSGSTTVADLLVQAGIVVS